MEHNNCWLCYIQAAFLLPQNTSSGHKALIVTSLDAGLLSPAALIAFVVVVEAGVCGRSQQRVFVLEKKRVTIESAMSIRYFTVLPIAGYR